MCGIAGIYNLNGTPVENRVIVQFLDSMEHRGPDGSGISMHCNEQLAFGHRRLSILDLSENGGQPMHYADKQLSITYNGEIYNFLELRQELKQKGHTFRTDSDTEVILAAYLEWGVSCFSRFNGMWAFAIWDDRQQKLILSRDRFGIKPLYYTLQPGKQLAFASETRAFTRLSGFDRRLNEQLAAITLNDDYALEGLGYTVFEGIYQLLPGHYAEFNLSDTQLKQRRWYSILPVLHADRQRSDANAAAEAFRELIYSACRYRLISDVPLATALSGGLDSSSVFAAVQKVLAENPQRVNKNSQKAVSAIFPGLENDERAYVEMMLKHTGKEAIWVETVYDDLIGQIEKDTRMLDAVSSAPLTSIASIYNGMRQAGITVSLDGHGVDEMMYGYRDMVATLFQYYLWNGTMDMAKSAGETLAGMYHPSHQQAGLARVNRQLLEKQQRESGFRYKLKKLIGKKDPFAGQFMPVALPALGEPYDFKSFPIETRMVLHETFQHTLPALFRNFDRASMMNSIEIRMPFMDYRIVEFLFTVPPSMKFGKGMTKLLLRQAMQHDLPEGIIERKFKVGISSPAEYWFNGPLQPWFMDQTRGSNIRSTLEKEYKEQGRISKPNITRAWKEINLKMINT
jgi:asparagine synthase (glutamine-hydrolysing)